MMYGYARVSTTEQNTDSQRKEVIAFANADGLTFFHGSVTFNFNRKGYNALVGTETTAPLLHENDLLIICSLDRLGRNYTEIKKQWEYITNTLKANIKVLDMPLLDTSTAANNLDGRFIADLVLQILSYTAEKERENTEKRRLQGTNAMPIVNGKKVSLKTGRPTGRPNATYPENWEPIYNNWKSGAITATAAIEHLGMKRTTFYKLVKQYETK